MKIQVGKNTYYVDSDEKQFVVYTKFKETEKDGKTTKSISDPSYLSNMGSVLKFVVEREMKKRVNSGEVETLKEYIDQIKGVKAELMEAVR